MKQLILILLAIPFCVNAQYTGDTYAQAKQKKNAKWVYTYSEAPGFASKSASGSMTGITPDIMEKFAEYVKAKEGITVKVEYQMENSKDFPKFLDKVKNSHGGVFGLSNTTITEERKSVYKFSPPYITNVGMILTHKSVPTVNDIAEISEKFKGLKAVTVKNSTNEKRILDIKKKYLPNLQIVYVPSFMDAVNMISKDPSTFTNVDFTYYFDAAQNRVPIKRHPGGDDQTEQFGIIMPMSNDWTPLMDEFMASFVGSTEYKKIILDNLGQSAMNFFDTLK